MVRGGRAEAPVPRSDVSFRLHQKAGNFKAAPVSRPMQRSALPEAKQKNQLAAYIFSLHKIIIIITGAIIITGGGNHVRLSFASISALHCSKRRVTSRWPLLEAQCNGVHPLKKSKRINLRK